MSAPHHASNATGDFVIIAAFVSCWVSAGRSGRRAVREIQRRLKREDEGR